MINLGTARNIMKSDIPNDRFNMVMVTNTSGTLSFNQVGGNTINIDNVPTGVWIPVGNAVNINNASTATGFMVV